MIVINNRSRKGCSPSQNRWSLKYFTLVIFLRIKHRMEFKPQHQLCSNVIKNALKAYLVVLLTTSKYQVCAVRSLYVDGVSKEKIWITRHQLESLRVKNPYVVCFFTCIAALSEGKHEKKNRRSNSDSSNSEDDTVSEQNFCPGIILWVMFNWPESGLTYLREIFPRKFSFWPWETRRLGKISLIFFP